VSQPTSTSGSPIGGVQVPKAKSNVYTVMLLLAFLALCAGCGFLALELERYSWELKPGSQRNPAAVQTLDIERPQLAQGQAQGTSLGQRLFG